MLNNKSRTLPVQQNAITPIGEQESKIIITLNGSEADKFMDVKARYEEEIGFRLHNHQVMSKIFQNVK